jgi:hypothetical protein
MKKTTTFLLLLAAIPCRAAGPAPEAAWSTAQVFGAFTRQCPAVLPEFDGAPAQGKPLSSGPDDGFISIQALSQLPPTDSRTAAWLASRIPGLNTAALKTVPGEPVDAVLARAAAARASYLDIFTDPGLGHGKPALYYLSQDVLGRLNRKWVSGTLPVNGTAKDGQPFNMQALVVGNGSVYILYDRSQFSFKEDGHEFKITDSGRVAVSVLGAADVGVSGVKGCGCKGPFCGCADIQRITKTGPTSVRVKTSRGDQNSSLDLIHLRQSLARPSAK